MFYSIPIGVQNEEIPFHLFKLQKVAMTEKTIHSNNSSFFMLIKLCSYDKFVDALKKAQLPPYIAVSMCVSYTTSNQKKSEPACQGYLIQLRTLVNKRICYSTWKRVFNILDVDFWKHKNSGKQHILRMAGICYNDLYKRFYKFTQLISQEFVKAIIQKDAANQASRNALKVKCLHGFFNNKLALSFSIEPPTSQDSSALSKLKQKYGEVFLMLQQFNEFVSRQQEIYHKRQQSLCIGKAKGKHDPAASPIDESPLQDDQAITEEHFSKKRVKIEERLAAEDAIVEDIESDRSDCFIREPAIKKKLKIEKKRVVVADEENESSPQPPQDRQPSTQKKSKAGKSMKRSDPKVNIQKASNTKPKREPIIKLRKKPSTKQQKVNQFSTLKERAYQEDEDDSLSITPPKNKRVIADSSSEEDIKSSTHPKKAKEMDCSTSRKKKKATANDSSKVYACDEEEDEVQLIDKKLTEQQLTIRILTNCQACFENRKFIINSKHIRDSEVVSLADDKEEGEEEKEKTKHDIPVIIIDAEEDTASSQIVSSQKSCSVNKSIEDQQLINYSLKHTEIKEVSASPHAKSQQPLAVLINYSFKSPELKGVVVPSHATNQQSSALLLDYSLKSLEIEEVPPSSPIQNQQPLSPADLFTSSQKGKKQSTIHQFFSCKSVLVNKQNLKLASNQSQMPLSTQQSTEPLQEAVSINQLAVTAASKENIQDRQSSSPAKIVSEANMQNPLTLVAESNEQCLTPAKSIKMSSASPRNQPSPAKKNLPSLQQYLPQEGDQEKNNQQQSDLVVSE